MIKNKKLLIIMILAAGCATLHAQNTNQKEKNNPQRQKTRAEKRAQDELQREAKIKLEDARETALKEVSGTVESSELERENKQLVYSFDIRDAQGKINEVQVSAISGQIVSVKQETAAQQIQEKKQEERENIRSPRTPSDYRRQVRGEDSDDEINKASFIAPQRPTASNSAEFQRPGVLQLAYGYDSNFRQPGTPSQQLIPMSLRFAISSRVLVEFDNTNFLTQTAPDGTRQSGIGSTNLGVQYVIHHQNKTTPGIAASYYIKIPTASSVKGLGTGRVDHIFTGLASKNIGSITVDFNAVCLLAGKQGQSGHASSGQAALAFSRGFTSKFGGTAEISGYSRSDNSPGGILGLVGGSYQVNRRFSLYSGVRFGLTHDTPRIGVLAGVTVGIANLYKKKG